MYKQLLLDIVDVIDQDVVDAYQQLSQKTVQQISEQSDTNQYEFILQIVAYLNRQWCSLFRIKTLFEEQLEEHINNDYETIIQNLEGSIRSHIRIQQQQKLQIESLMQKLEEITQEKDLIIKSLQERINKLNLQASSPIEIAQNKTRTSAFERLSKLVSNQSQKSLQNSINEAHFKALVKICNTEKDHSVSKVRRQYSAKRETGLIRTTEDTQNLEPRPLETERLRDTIIKHRVQKSEKIGEQASLSTDKQRYKGPIRGSPLLNPQQQLSSQSFDHVGKNLMALKRQQTNSRLQNTQSSQLLKFLQKK